MKKFLRIIVIIFIIVGIGSALLIKNTHSPFSQKIFTFFGISATTGEILTGQVTTGIDLTNCISYFDGCNNCSVKDGKPDACTMMYCEKPSTPKCLRYTK